MRREPGYSKSAETAMTVVVTGGYGFIGSHFLSLLRRQRPRWRIVNIDKLTYAGSRQGVEGISEGDRYRFVRGDVADLALVNRVFDEERPDAVVHLAAESHVDRSILDPGPFLHTNVLGTQALLEAGRAFGTRAFLHVSTDEVYGDAGPQGAPFTEESPFRPSNPYSASKAAADLMAQAYYRTYGLPVRVVRLCNSFGPRQLPEKLIPLMIRNLLRAEGLPLYGDGMQRRDWLYVADGARALLAVVEQGRDGRTYNVAAHQELPNREVLGHLFEAYAAAKGLAVDALWRLVETVADRPGHDFRYAMNDERIRTETDWAPTVSFEKGLRDTVDWYLSHQPWLDDVDTAEYRRVYEAIYSRGRGQN